MYDYLKLTSTGNGMYVTDEPTVHKDELKRTTNKIIIFLKKARKRRASHWSTHGLKKPSGNENLEIILKIDHKSTDWLTSMWLTAC